MLNNYLLLLFVLLIQFQTATLELASGQIEFRLDNFSQFANGPIDTEKMSSAKIIRGLAWKLKATLAEENGKKFLSCSFVVICDESSDWSCPVEAEVEINVGESKILSRNFAGCVDNTKIKSWKFGEQIDKLLAHCQSIQNNELIVNAILKLDPPCGKHFRFTDTLIVKETSSDAGTPVNVNKKLLALYSPFFNQLFYSNRCPSSSVSYQPVVQLEPPSTNYQPIVQLPPASTLLHFRQMILLLHYGDGILNDANVDAFLRLGNWFQIEEIKGRCAKFLLDAKCKMTKLRRFHIASQFGLPITKNLILNGMKCEDFSDGKNFLKNHNEMRMFSKEEGEQIVQRFHQLFPDALTEDNDGKRQKVGQQNDENNK